MIESITEQMTKKNPRLQYREFQTFLGTATVYESDDTPYEKALVSKFDIKKGSPWPKRIPDGTYPYIITQEGIVRIPTLPREKIFVHHPQLANNGGVIAAGVLTVRDKKVVQFDNKSGHYRPGIDSLTYAQYVFKFLSIPTSEVARVQNHWAFIK